MEETRKGWLWGLKASPPPAISEPLRYRRKNPADRDQNATSVPEKVLCRVWLRCAKKWTRQYFTPVYFIITVPVDPVGRVLRAESLLPAGGGLRRRAEPSWPVLSSKPAGRKGACSARGVQKGGARVPCPGRLTFPVKVRQTVDILGFKGHIGSVTYLTLFFPLRSFKNIKLIHGHTRTSLGPNPTLASCYQSVVSEPARECVLLVVIEHVCVSVRVHVECVRVLSVSVHAHMLSMSECALSVCVCAECVNV